MNKPNVLLWALVAAFAGILFANLAHASADPVADVRQIMAATVTTKSVKQAYLSGARDNTTAFQGALTAYKAVRAAEAAPVPPVVLPPSSGTVAPLTPIADNFPTANGIATASWGIPPSMAPDPVGAFRMICGAGQLNYDDAIVYPGQHGKSHLHQYYGNLAVDGMSDYASLRTTGGTTCGDPTLPYGVNRSGYWMPAMLDGAGHVVKPEYVAIYYKRIPQSDPKCKRSNPGSVGDCVGIPTGLKFITGYNMLGGTTDAHPFFYCQDSDLGGAKAIRSTLHNSIPEAIPDCPIGARLTLNIAGPDCWDGKNLDSPDHRSHLAHGSYVWDGALNQSYYRCDDAHPKHIPQMSLMAFYPVDANFVAGKWHLSSDEMVPGAPAGTTFHADYWEAWSPTVRETWQANCIDGHLNCAGGDLGDGTVIKGMTVPNTSGLVPVPL
jgi:hypothetical protein